jgi:ribonuclease P protein component
VLPGQGRDGWDYVLIGRADATVSRRFADLVSDLEAALAKLHGAAR